MTLLNIEDKSSITLSTIFIIVALIGILIGFETCNGGVDEGLFTSKEITIKERPEYKNPTRPTPKHYLIYSNEYLSPFWITGTGLSIVNDNEKNLRPFRKRVNDTLKVMILASRQNSLDNPNEHVDVYGLADSKQEYFNPAMVSKTNNNRSRIILSGSSVLLIIGLLLKIRKKLRPAPAA